MTNIKRLKKKSAAGRGKIKFNSIRKIMTSLWEPLAVEVSFKRYPKIHLNNLMQPWKPTLEIHPLDLARHCLQIFFKTQSNFILHQCKRRNKITSSKNRWNSLRQEFIIFMKTLQRKINLLSNLYKVMFRTNTFKSHA
jgi:hypothetical protein